jgi:hypothetical protein
MKPSNSKPEAAPRPEDFLLGSEQSRAAARALLEAAKPQPANDIATRLIEARKRGRERPPEPPMTAKDCLEMAERLRKTARPGDEQAQRVIRLYERRARFMREEEAEANARAQGGEHD